MLISAVLLTIGSAWRKKRSRIAGYELVLSSRRGSDGIKSTPSIVEVRRMRCLLSARADATACRLLSWRERMTYT